MKKISTKLFPFILLLCSCFYSNAQQTFCPPGAYWHYDVNGPNSGGFIQIQYVNDTIIQGTTCKKLTQVLYSFYDPNSNVHSITNLPDIFISQIGDTVYRYDDGGVFRILYNFSAVPGDEWMIDSVSFTSDCDSVSIIHVDSAGTEVFNNDTLRWISVHPTLTSSRGMYGRIYERYGSENYLIPIDVNVCDSSIIVDWPYFNIHCYEDSTHALYNFGTNDCEFLMHLGIEDIDPLVYSIYPNPVSTSISVEGPLSNQSEIRIINPEGQLLYSKKYDRREIGLNLPNGIYYLQIVNDFSIVTKKFLVIN